MQIHVFNGKKTTRLGVHAETYEDIAKFILEQEGVEQENTGEVPATITTALMASLGWHKNPIFVGWFHPNYAEVKEKREYKPCSSLYIQKVV